MCHRARPRNLDLPVQLLIAIYVSFDTVLSQIHFSKDHVNLEAELGCSVALDGRKAMRAP